MRYEEINVEFTGDRLEDFKNFAMQPDFDGWSNGDIKYAFYMKFPQYLKDNMPDPVGVKPSQIARDVRIVLNKNWMPKSIGDGYLLQEPELYIADGGKPNNDANGDWVFISSEHQPDMKEHITGVNSGTAYLTEINLKYPVRR